MSIMTLHVCVRMPMVTLFRGIQKVYCIGQLRVLLVVSKNSNPGNHMMLEYDDDINDKAFVLN